MKNRSRNTSYLLVIFSALLILSFGCKDDFFDQKPGDKITPQQHYNSFTDAKVSLQGAMVSLQDVMPQLIILDGLRSDIMEITPNADSYLKELYYQVFSVSNPLTNASDLYKVIINVNEVLANIDQISSKDYEFDDFTAYSYKGALIGLRAYAYLTLVRLYNKAVYIEDNMASLPDNMTQTPLSKNEIIDKLIGQLETYFESEYTTTKYNEIRIAHYVNNKAMLGELYLEAGRYADAAYYLKLACESYGNTAAMLKADKTYKDAAWSSIFLNAESQDVENIFVIPYDRAEDQFNPINDYAGKANSYMIRPTRLLVDSFMVQNTAAGLVGDLWRGLGVTFNTDTISKINDSTFVTENYITKYAIDQTNWQSSDIVLSRAADIHLMLCEAYNRIGDETSQQYALMLLNQGVNKENPKPAPFTKWSGNLGIRGRAYLKSREVPERDSVSVEERTIMIENSIMDERMLELAYEGKRWFDLVRVAERRNDPAYLADKVAAKFKDTPEYDVVRNKLLNPANWYLPYQ